MASVAVEKVSTDSRTVKRGELFVALRGENFDGHKFVEGAARAGAAGAIVDRDLEGERAGNLRASARGRSRCELIRISRRIIENRCLSKCWPSPAATAKPARRISPPRCWVARFRVTKTEGNFNNHVGLPRTMLEATSQDEIAVWEIGMNHPGEIAALAKIAAPDVAIITNVGVAHIEFMGSREAIAQEKGALAEAIGPDGWVVLNADDPFSAGIARDTQARVIFAGTDRGRGSRRRNQPKRRADPSLPSWKGRIAAARSCPCPVCTWCKTRCSRSRRVAPLAFRSKNARAGLATAPLTKARLQIKEIHGVQFIDDSYNANPDSMKAALRTLVELEADGTTDRGARRNGRAGRGIRARSS